MPLLTNSSTFWTTFPSNSLKHYDFKTGAKQIHQASWYCRLTKSGLQSATTSNWQVFLKHCLSSTASNCCLFYSQMVGRAGGWSPRLKGANRENSNTQLANSMEILKKTRVSVQEYWQKSVTNFAISKGHGCYSTCKNVTGMHNITETFLFWNIKVFILCKKWSLTGH